jgi:ATP-dependent exoDNAse (exonuclease V) beta subunit
MEEIEEERRLFYVALTRAKDWLYVCHPPLPTPRIAGSATVTATPSSPVSCPIPVQRAFRRRPRLLKYFPSPPPHDLEAGGAFAAAGLSAEGHQEPPQRPFLEVLGASSMRRAGGSAVSPQDAYRDAPSVRDNARLLLKYSHGEWLNA